MCFSSNLVHASRAAAAGAEGVPTALPRYRLRPAAFLWVGSAARRRPASLCSVAGRVATCVAAWPCQPRMRGLASAERPTAQLPQASRPP